MAVVPTTKNILIAAGDPSGDVHAANLIRALKKLDPELNVAALGGARMQEVSDKFIYNLVEVGAAGFAEPFKRIPLWLRLISLVRKYMEERRPACFIAVDFYGLNHELLGLASHRRIPSYYYISPQVWASRPGRAERMAPLVKSVLSIFPMDGKYYTAAGVDWHFVGHPLLDLVPAPQPTLPARPPDHRWKIGLLPGSRPYEINGLMPIFWESFLQIRRAFPSSEAYVFAAREVSDSAILSACAKAGGGAPKIVREDDYAVRSTMDAALTCSGTATLENALLGIPMAVAYRLPWLSYHIARRVITVKHIALPNIVAGKQIVREFIQHDAAPKPLAGAIMALLQNPESLLAMRTDLLKVRAALGSPGVAERAASFIHSSAFPSSNS